MKRRAGTEKTVEMTAFQLYGAAVAILGLVMLGQLPAGCQGQQQGSQCTNAFLNIFGQCMTNSTPAINFQNFLWLTRDGSMGTQPTDLPAFTQQVCGLKDSLYDCGKVQVGRIQAASATLCSDVDKSNIDQFFKSVFKKLNTTCAHPCRNKLVSSLRMCFETADVNPDLFLPNITMPRHSLIGDNKGNITAFCDKRDEVIECMRTNTVICPDTHIVLPASGIDVDALNETITLLCDNRQIYLHGTRCSSNRTMAEEKCQTTLVNQLVELENQFQNINITLDVYTTDMCRLRLDNVRCDLNAMESREKNAKCDDVVLGLRREQECKLVPETCKMAFSDRLLDMCNPKLFHTDERTAYVGQLKSSASEGPRQVVAVVVPTVIAAVVMTLFHAMFS